MLRLVKYDLRRSKDQILGIFVVIMLIQIGLVVSAEFVNWGKESLLTGFVTTYLVGGIILLFQAWRTFMYNLKAYHRRLLPLKEVYTVMSPLLMYLFLLLGLTAMALIHAGLYTLFDPDVLPSNLWSYAFVGLYLMLWSACFQLILLMLAVTVAQSVNVKKRGRIWIGIAVYFVVQYGIAWLGQWIFGSANYSFENAFQLEVTQEASRSVEGLRVTGEALPVWGTLLEVGFAVLLIYVIAKLIRRRVES